MANDFYQFSGSVTPGSTIRSDKYNSDMRGIETGFDLVNKKTERSLLISNELKNNILPLVLNKSLVTLSPEGVGVYDFSEFSNALESARESLERTAEIGLMVERAEQAANRSDDILRDVAERMLPTFARGNITLYKKHVLGAGSYIAPATSDETLDGAWFSIKRASGEPLILIPDKNINTTKFYRAEDGKEDTSVTIKVDDDLDRFFIFNKLTNKWEF